ncbi:MAG: ribose ABC transporter permease [Actinobacteria bacterium]|nr:ribose ABC transporter permease [Actinomycetota bacterium]
MRYRLKKRYQNRGEKRVFHINNLSQVLRKAAPFMSLGLMVIILSIISPYFLTVENLFAIGLQISVVAIMAIGQMMVIISAGIDLAAGSVLALSGIATTMLMATGIPIFPAIIAGLFAGALTGLASGALIAKGHLPPFIATLGMMGIARGMALLLTGGVPIFGLPKEFNFLGGGRFFGVIPVPVIITVVLAVIGHIILTRLRFGRYVFAIGSNTNAAKLSGINVSRTLVIIYAINGLLCGFAGIIMASRLSTGQPTAGMSYELDVIAACVIGGASLSGGEGTILGAIIGALIMGVLRNGCNLLDVSAFWQQIAIGTIIIIAVLSDQYRKHKAIA